MAPLAPPLDPLRTCSEAEKEREREFWAVVKVQAWFRAQRIRSYLK